MNKFNVGDKLYWFGNNSEVIVESIFPVKQKTETVYVVKHVETQKQFQEKESYLCKTKEIFEGTTYRIGDEVYFISKQKNKKPIWHEIVDIYLDKDISKYLLFKCKDENGNIRNFSASDISLYDYVIKIRL